MTDDRITPPRAVQDRLWDNRYDPSYITAYDTMYGEGSATTYITTRADTPPTGVDTVIPDASASWLLENQNDALSLKAFDNRYGAGASERILSAGNPPEPVETEQTRGYTADLLIAPFAGVQDAFNGVGMLGDYIGDAIFGGTGRFVWGDGNGFRWVSHDEFLSLSEAAGGSVTGATFVPEAETLPGQIVQGVTSFAVPFAGAMSKVGKGTTAASQVFRAFTVGAAVDFTVWNPNDPNLSSALIEIGIPDNVVTDMLATDPNDPQWLNRFRNAAEGAAAGVVVETIMYGLRGFRAQAAGDVVGAEAAKTAGREAIERSVGEVRETIEATGRETAQQVRQVEQMLEANQADAAVSTTKEVPVEQAASEAATPVANSGFRLTEEQARRVREIAEILGRNQAEGSIAAEAFHTNLPWRSIRSARGMEDIMAEMAAMRMVMADQFDQIRGAGTQTWSQVNAAASARIVEAARLLRTEPEELIKRFDNLPTDSNMAIEMHMRSDLLVHINRNISEMADQLLSGNIPSRYVDADEMRLAILHQMDIAANLGARQASAVSNIGRSLRAQNMIKSNDARMAALVKNAVQTGADNLDATLRLIRSGKVTPLEAATTDLRSLLQKGMDRVNFYRTNALLSGPGTQEINFLSTLLNSVLLPTQQIIGGGIVGQSARHGWRTLFYQMTSAWDAIKTARKVFVEDQAILDPVSSKFDNAFATEANKNWLDTIIALPSRGLLTMDEFFKQSAYRGRVMADAIDRARNLKMTGKEREAYIQNYLRESFGPNGEALRGDVLEQARKITFTEELERGSFARKFQGVMQGEGFGPAAARFVLPFFKTPVNILSQSFQNMPGLQFLSKRFMDDLRSGDPARAAQARGKIVTGLAITTFGLILAGTGRLTGGGPRDPRVNAEWRRNNQPRSMLITLEDGTEFWWDYSRYEPLANVLSVFADLYEITTDQYNDADRTNAAAAVVLALAENTINKSFTKGIADFLEILSGRQQSERAFYNAIASFQPNLLNQINGDTAFREVRDLLDAFQARNGLYNNVDPRRDILGAIVLRPNSKMDPAGIGSVVNAVVNGNSREVDPVMEEISRLSIHDGSAFAMPTSSVYVLEDGNPVPQRRNLKDIKYGDGPQSLYDRWLELSGTIEIRGKTLYQALAELMQSNAYQRNMIDGVGGGRGTRAYAISKIINVYRKRARSQIPELVDVLRESERITRTTNLNELSEQRLNDNRERFSAFFDAFGLN